MSSNDFASDLRGLWSAAGAPSYRQVSRDLEVRGRYYSKSTIADVLRGIRLPRAAMLRDLVTYLGGDVERWEARLASLRSSPKSGGSGPGGADPVVPVLDFTGRSEYLLQLDEALTVRDDAPRIVTIVGPSGIGKSALAAYWAAGAKHRFPDGQLHVDLHGFGSGPPLTLATAVRRLLDMLGTAVGDVPADVEGQVALYRRRLAGKRVLVVLDNAGASEHVLPLLPPTAGSAMIVTSRMRLSKLAVLGAQPVVLDAFTEGEAREFMAKRLGRARINTESAAVAALLRYCGGLPLALSIMTARAATQPHLPLHVLVDELADESTRLDALTVDDLENDVRGVFRWSYRSLRPEVAQAFRLAGLLPRGEFGLAAAAALLEKDLTTTRRLLRQLAAAHLVRQQAVDRFVMHDLVRLFAAECAAEHRQEAATAARSLCVWYLAVADSADRILAPHRTHVLPSERVPVSGPELTDHDAAMAWYDTEHVKLASVVRLSVEHALHDTAWRLPIAAFSYYKIRHNWREWLEVQRIALEAAEAAEAMDGVAWVLNAIGIAETNLGLHEQALSSLGRSLEIRRSLHDTAGISQVLNNLSEVNRRLGRTSEAIKYAQADYDLSTEVGDTYGALISINNLGKALLADRQPTAALNAQLEALNSCLTIGEPHIQAEVHADLGHIYRHLGATDTAIDHYHKAANLARAVGDHLINAGVLVEIAEIAFECGRHDAAREFAGQARNASENITGAGAHIIRNRANILLSQ